MICQDQFSGKIEEYFKTVSAESFTQHTKLSLKHEYISGSSCSKRH